MTNFCHNEYLQRDLFASFVIITLLQNYC